MGHNELFEVMKSVPLNNAFKYQEVRPRSHGSLPRSGGSVNSEVRKGEWTGRKTIC